MTLKAHLTSTAHKVEAAIEALLPDPDQLQGRLHQAMRYSILGGGKRLRAFLTIETGRLIGVDHQACLRIGCALEMIHAYSLIHDDLPAMDDAALRRGRAACHRAFDDATAILAGDALQALAFEVIAGAGSPVVAAARAPLCADLARAAGAAGMCGGQMLDLLGENQAQDIDLVLLTQSLKTGALFDFACTAPCHLTGDGARLRTALQAFAAAFGLAFQIQDDILDVTGDAAKLGKDLGRDQASEKSTFVSHYGLEGAKAHLERLRTDGLNALARLPGDTAMLRELMDASINRQA